MNATMRPAQDAAFAIAAEPSNDFHHHGRRSDWEAPGVGGGALPAPSCSGLKTASPDRQATDLRLGSAPSETPRRRDSRCACDPAVAPVTRETTMIRATRPRKTRPAPVPYPVERCVIYIRGGDLDISVCGSDLGKDGECGSAEVRGLHAPPDEGGWGARHLGRAFGVIGHHWARLVVPARTASTTSMIASVTSLGCSLWTSWPLFVFVMCLAPGTSAAKRSWAFFCAASVM